jgi:tetratricopeptide (TPR) repeat protein
MKTDRLREPYIGREKVLEQIDFAIRKSNKTKVFCIDGDGGIGKTRLLAEIYRRYGATTPSVLRTLDIIDFDDSSFHIPGNVESHIAQMIGVHQFENYWQKARDFHAIERAGISPRELSNQRAQVRATFVTDFNNFSVTTRVILLLDTAEKQKTEETWQELINVIGRLSNVLVLIAGRHATSVWANFSDTLGAVVEVINLEPLDYSDSKNYLEQKQKILHINIRPDISEGLLKLAQGHPILLDLAVDWLARDLPQDWISELATVGPTDHDMSDRTEKFEKLLVTKFTQIRTAIDRLTLLLSRVYPLDVDGIAELLRISDEDAANLFEEAKSYVFFKELPGGEISLHDEMRRMVTTYVWDQVDPDLQRRAHDSRLATVYLKRKINKLEDKLQQLSRQEENSSISNETPVFSRFVELGVTERDGWVLRGQYLEHLLSSSFDEGLDEFNRLIDASPGINARDILCNVIDQYFDRIPDRQKYEVVIRKIKLLTDKGIFDEALSLANLPTVNPSQKLDVRIKVANAKMRMGKVSQAVADLHEALTLAQTLPDEVRWTSQTLNLLGQAHRTMGKLHDASGYYEQALKLAREHPTSITKIQAAATLNNLAYVWSREGRHRSAFAYCKEALVIREHLGTKFDVGISHSTIGEIYRNWGKYSEALESYNLALQIFEPENSPLWLARVYSQRGAVYRLLNEYALAERDLLRSIQYNIPIEKPAAYHVLGLVHWNRNNDLDAAIEKLKISDQLARATDDAITLINNLVAFAEIDYILWKSSGSKDLERIAHIEQGARDLTALLVSGGYDFPSRSGRLQRVLGDIAFDQQRYDDAMKIYAEAYAQLGMRSGGYGRRTFLDEIDSLSDRIKMLAGSDVKAALYWCDYLREFWSDETKQLTRRDELVSLCDVNRIEIELKLN